MPKINNSKRSSASKEFQLGPPWITGKVLKKPETIKFQVELPDGQVIHRHADQFKHNLLDPQIPLQPETNEQWLLPDADSNQPQQEMPKITKYRHSTSAHTLLT